ncbi:MAG: molybdopterin-dependent oxidoreductase [Candidatus Geothermarchaeales archaeon]
MIREAERQVKVIPTGCAHDCGGKCLLYVRVRGGKIEGITAPTELPGTSRRIPQRACKRGLRYHKRVYHSDRLKQPMRRVGERGSGEFKAISWGEALDEVAGELLRVKEEYGNASILGLALSGTYTATLHNVRDLGKRFLNMFGGHTELMGSYSFEATKNASFYTYGTIKTDHSRDDLPNSKLIILWGWNPMELLFGSDTTWYLVEAKRRGARIVCVDPRYTASASMAHLWIPIRPGTDVAMMSAMAYVIISEGLHDKNFLDEYTVGFEKYREYILGVEDGLPKTPEWAEEITLVPAKTIADLAREYATRKPAALMPGAGPQRTSSGEQFSRAASVLATITGNVGISGGNPAGANWGPDIEGRYRSLPVPENPIGVSIPIYLWSDAVLKGTKGGYPSDIKVAYSAAGNILNQHADINKSVRALKRLEFLVVHEHFMTPTARFADILLPVCTWMERNDILVPWAGHGNFLIFQNKVIEPLYETKTDLEVFTELANRLGFGGEFNPRTEDEWLRYFVENSEIPDYDEFRERGIHVFERSEPHVAFREQIRDKKPFPTPSGKIEIYSQRLADMGDTKIPSIPKYIESWEGPFDPLTDRFPLQLITPHKRDLINSTLYELSRVEEAEKQSVWMNPRDAGARGVRDGDEVRVFNERGSTILPALVTKRVMPGVVVIYEGVWYTPDEEGVDRAGSANVLTRDKPTPIARATTQHTSLVQVEKLR